MLKDTQAKAVSANFEDRKADSGYTAPEVFSVGLAKDLIQGPMINGYHDCLGNQMTLSRPNC